MLSPARPTASPDRFACRWSSPSNIAIVKYWGKRPGQLPANASLSFTLDACRTDTVLEIRPRCADGQRKGGYELSVLLDGVPAPAFEPKILQFFDRIAPYAPYLEQYAFRLRTSNTFPHSSGIASSASGMSALAACLTDFESCSGAQPYPEAEFRRRASFYARLGSGSAARSIYGGAVLWGRCDRVASSSDLYAVALPREEVHPVFRDFCDTVLLIEQGAKSVSSSAGHALMDGHPYAPVRFGQAQQRVERLLDILRAGDVEAFGRLAESEALTLHAMMMTADPAYILFRAGTVAVVEKVMQARRETGLPLYFTLDAGANVHLLYPACAQAAVRGFIQDELSGLCGGRMIHDRVGAGARKESL